MRIRLTFALGEDDREAIAEHYGEAGKADRETCITFIYAAVTGALEDNLGSSTVVPVDRAVGEVVTDESYRVDQQWPEPPEDVTQ